MTDVGPAPGWWLASDGRWYSPSSHPDPAHRARWASVAEPGQAVSEMPTEGVPSVLDLPTDGPADASQAEVATPVPGPAPSYPGTPPSYPGTPVPSPGVAPVYPGVAPAWSAPGTATAAGPLPGLPAEVPVPPAPRPPSAWPDAVPRAAPPAPTGNIAAAVVASVAAVLACVGTFLAWVEAETPVASQTRSGWHIGTDGRITLIAGFVAAAAAGVAWIGLRHVLLKVAFGAGAIALLAVFVVELLDVLELKDDLEGALEVASVSVGIGLWFVLAAGVLLTVAAVLERSRIRIPRR